MKTIEKAVEFRKRFDDVRYKDMFFEKKGFLYTPVQDWASEIYFAESLSSYLMGLERSLPLLRNSILDESLPLYVFNLPGLFAGGRVTDASILGMFEYSEAIPELLEVAQHDLNREMRATSVESIGDMKEISWNMVPLLCKILLGDKSFYVKENTAEALRKIGNPFAIESLRNSFDEAKAMVQNYELVGYPFNFKSRDPFEENEVDSACMLIEQSLRALFDLNSRMGREALSEGLNSWSDTVYHWTKRAAFWLGFNSKERIDCLQNSKLSVLR